LPLKQDSDVILRTLPAGLAIATFLVSLVAMCSAASADEPSFGPIIEGYGPTYPIDDRDVALEEGFVYRAAFDADSYPGEPDQLNRTLVSVARFLNMHGRNGVPAGNMELAVVVHGAALKAMLTNKAYRSRYETDNPNLELIDKLSDAGVEFYICGQSMAFGGVEKDELVEPASVALSAMTALTTLQAQDYALLPW
jgi:intracellular sulfur oxidation DsrE/DsrF family protein